MSGNAISYGGGPIQQMYDSCGPDGGDGPHALCGFVFGSGAKDPPADDILRPQVQRRTLSWFLPTLLSNDFLMFLNITHIPIYIIEVTYALSLLAV